MSRTNILLRATIMGKFLLIFGLVNACLLTKGSNCYCQEQSFAPYLGVSGSMDTNVHFGWGIEAGLRFFQFYVGGEYGTYSYQAGRSVTWDPTPGSVPRPAPISTEQFWGIHAGYVIDNVYYLGVVILSSNELWGRGDTVAGWVTYTNHYLNIGPDFRYAGLAQGHLYLALALTVRRGFKFGLGYMF